MLHNMLRAAAGNRGGFSAAILADNPAAYWKLEDGSGTVANEEISGANGGYVGTYDLSAAGIVEGSPNSLDTLNAGHMAASYANMPTFASSASFSVEIAFVPNVTYTFGSGSSTVAVCSHDDEVNGWAFWFDTSVDTGIRFLTNSGNVQTTSISSLSAGSLYHLIAAYNGSTGNVQWFVNGTTDNSGNPNYQGPPVSSWDGYVGYREAGGARMDARMGHFAIYDYALNSTQAQNHWDAI